MAETKKLRKNNEKQNKDYEKEIKKATEGVKPLGRPLPNKFLALLIKNHIVNGDE